MTTITEVSQLSFEQAMSELERVVQSLEKGDLTLDDAVKVYERGILLKQHCETKLNEAKMRVEKIEFDGDGNIVTKPVSDKEA